MSQIIEKPKTYPRTPHYIIPMVQDVVPRVPGEHLKEKIDEMNISDEEFAREAGLSLEVLLLLYKGIIPISQELAEKLEKVTLIPAELWLRFEKHYRADLVNAAKKYRLAMTG